MSCAQARGSALLLLLLLLLLLCSQCRSLCLLCSYESHRPSVFATLVFGSSGNDHRRRPLIHLDSTSDPDRPLFSFSSADASVLRRACLGGHHRHCRATEASSVPSAGADHLRLPRQFL
ncbi:hypothetical protein V8C35DRAFT_295891 [Trichoderma chlorosporum]